MEKIKFKSIRSHIDNKIFLCRLAYYFKSGKTLKLHLILRDDKDKPHTHPWDFKSLLLIPYKEELEGKMKWHWPLKLLKRNMKQSHKVKLYRILWIPIPALSIGLYSEKKQLCSFCEKLGYCKESNKH